MLPAKEEIKQLLPLISLTYEKKSANSATLVGKNAAD